MIGGSYDQFGDPRRLDALAAALSSKPWVRVLDTDHFFGGAMEALAEACRDAIAWAQSTASL